MFIRWRQQHAWPCLIHEASPSSSRRASLPGSLSSGTAACHVASLQHRGCLFGKHHCCMHKKQRLLDASADAACNADCSVSHFAVDHSCCPLLHSRHACVFTCKVVACTGAPLQCKVFLEEEAGHLAQGCDQALSHLASICTALRQGLVDMMAGLA